MADSKISGLTAAASLDGSELVEAVQGGVNVQTTTGGIAALAAAGSGHVIEDEGTPLTQRTKLNFVGAGVTVTDDSGDDASVVTIPASVSDTAYDATSWNGVTDVAPSKNAVRDKIESMGSLVGAQDLFITAPAMWAKATNGCATPAPFEIGGTATMISLDFDQTTDENAQFQVVFPRNWNNGTVTAAVYWTAVGGSGTVQFEISAAAFSNDDPLSGAFGTAVAIDDTLIATNDLHISPTSSSITIGGSPADADFILFNIMRDVSDDTLSADAKLLGIRLTITLDAPTSE